MQDLIVGENAYISREDAEDYLGARLYNDAWVEAEDTDRDTALIMATRSIDRLLLVGRPVDVNQPLGFPRRSQGWEQLTIPKVVRDAVCEEALAILDRGNSERRQMQADGLTSFQIGTLSEAYATGQSGRSLVPHGLISIEARELMRPWISGSLVIR